MVKSGAAKKVAVALLGGTILLSVPVGASAAEISSSVYGANSATYSSRGGVKVMDTAADSHRAEAQYKRGSTTASTQKVADTNGTAGSWVYSGTSSTLVVILRACTLNSNPFDSQTCDDWRTL